jgi:hypothetical protein
MADRLSVGCESFSTCHLLMPWLDRRERSGEEKSEVKTDEEKDDKGDDSRR